MKLKLKGFFWLSDYFEGLGGGVFFGFTIFQHPLYNFWETRHFFWIRYLLSIWTESVWTSIICKWFMRAGISLPELFSETINISTDRGWDSKKKPWKTFYMASYFHLMKILIHHLCILKDVSYKPDLSFVTDTLNIFTLNTYLLIKPIEPSQPIRCWLQLTMHLRLKHYSEKCVQYSSVKPAF